MSDQHILDIDVGNTRIKWRLLVNGSVGREGAFSHDDMAVEQLSNSISAKAIHRVRVASVVKAEVLSSLVEICRKLWGVKPEVAEVRQQCAGVEQGYKDLSRLGVDRWLGVLAAYNKYSKACLVVSCGTAVTIDFVNADGRHLGGYIVPGLNLMRQALFGGTNAVKVESFSVCDSLEPGRDTQSAVNNGLLLMLLSVIRQSSEQLSAKGGDFQIVLCGGDGKTVSEYLELEHVCQPALVLDGLALALP